MRAKCGPHGLIYDPVTQTGCVLCRKEAASRPPSAEPAEAAPTPPDVPAPAVPVAERAEPLVEPPAPQPLMSPWRLALPDGTSYTVREIAIALRLREIGIGLRIVAALTISFLWLVVDQGSIGMALVAAPVMPGLTAGLLRVTRFECFRDLRWLSYGVLAGCFAFVVGDGVRRVRADLVPQSIAWPGRAGLHYVKVHDAPWQATNTREDDEGRLVIQFAEDASVVPGGATGRGYLELVQSSLIESHHAEFGEPESIGSKGKSRDVHRAPVTLTIDGERMSGWLLIGRNGSKLERILTVMSADQLEPRNGTRRAAGDPYWQRRR
jgi:hypothetical protein